VLITSEDEKEPHAQKGSGGSDPETMEDLSESRPTASIQYSPEEAALPAEDEEASSQVIMMYGAYDTHNDTRARHTAHTALQWLTARNRQTREAGCCQQEEGHHSGAAHVPLPGAIPSMDTRAGHPGTLV